MKNKNSILIIIMTLFTLIISTSCLGKLSTKDNQSDGAEKNPTKASDIAVSLEVTPENYPRIDGSTSTLRLVQEIYKAVFKYVGYELSDIPQTASKTVPSYEKLISNQVDMILVPYASQEVLDKAHKAGVELEFHPVSTSYGVDSPILLDGGGNTILY
jgi:phosphate transport system substrate-binding protein